jgi:two-component system, OmpR family, alkaline phosphatase synthesis response regulator PhoP
MPKILIVDDSEDVLELLKTVLVLRDFEVLEALNGKQGIQVAKKEQPDLVILDLMLPDMDGISVCQTLKTTSETKNIPVIMLTARASILDKVKGLENGGDDYLVKPFDTLELLARVKVQLRQKGVALDEARQAIRIGQFQADPASYTVHNNGKEIKSLTPREFDILYILMKNSPKPVPREDIFQVIWDKSEKKYSRVIDIHIAKIRKKIKPQTIKTIPGKGYLFPS